MSAKIFLTQLGSRMRFGTFGEAVYEEIRDEEGKVTGIRNDPVIVPDDVAAQFEAEIKGDPPDPKTGKTGVPGRTDIRVERDAPAKTPALSVPALKAAQPTGKE